MASSSSSSMQEQELQLVKTITSLHHSISLLPSLHPSKEVNHLFTELVLACIPPSTIAIPSLPEDTQAMRSHLIRLCGQAEGHLESHYSAIIAAQDRPLDHLTMFPYYSNYVQLTELEFTLLSRHIGAPPGHVAFVGSGPLPLSSLLLAMRYLKGSAFHNYDLDEKANAEAAKLVEADPGLARRFGFRTENIMGVKRALARYNVVFLAALVGMGREEKREVIDHLARHMAPGALLVVRSAHGARAFLYPVVDLEDLKGFEVLSVYHPGDEVINSVIVARKKGEQGNGPGMVMQTCKCCEAFASSHLGGHGSLVEELQAMDGQPSSY
ncbi:nicotianamine synthase 3-like [Iris pallida]|uniref:Nicotianamine synthase n=2 Tax=Iris pallida TaxID=29817 RepID=A0AAX6DIP1_IRIPA|nr:nicotianamine synthase 3-like [Iris pallida]